MGSDNICVYDLVIETRKVGTLTNTITKTINKHLADGSWDVRMVPGIMDLGSGRFALGIYDYLERGTENVFFTADEGDLEQHEFHNATSIPELSEIIEVLRLKGILTTGAVITNYDGVETYTDLWYEGVHHGCWSVYEMAEFIIKHKKKETKE